MFLITIFRFILFYVFECFVLKHACAPNACLVPVSEEGVKTPGNGITDCCKLGMKYSIHHTVRINSISRLNQCPENFKTARNSISLLSSQQVFTLA